MKPVLFCIPLKPNCLEQYQKFVKQKLERRDEYRDLLKRYDIYSAKIWHKKIGERDYLFVYHDVGQHFEEKMLQWDNSQHPFDKWFRENMMAVYDIENAAGMEKPQQLVDFRI